MKSKIQSNTLSTGLAMFSMFFGAGNIVFPLAMGQYAQDHNFYAILGLIITAVGVPFLGLIAMTLFDGDYKKFFRQIGDAPGFIVVIFIMGLIGPFGAMPRTITLSFSTFSMFAGDLYLPYFSALACFLTFLLAYKQSKILDILGYVLTPILLLSLAILVLKGLISGPMPVPTEDTSFSIFLQGLVEGYQTMDLMGAFFFSSAVILSLQKELQPHDKKDNRKLIRMTIKAGCIGAFLLAITYIGFSYTAASYSATLENIPKEDMLGALALQVLGHNAGIVAILAVSLACLTTAIALATVFAQFVHKNITLEKLSYPASLALTMIATFFMSNLQFSGIMHFLFPILLVCYPSLIVLSGVSILEKLYGFQYVKLPVLITFIATVLVYFL